MPNLRIVYDNAADRATLSASSTAGSLVVDNLHTDIKPQVWRSTSVSATLTALFASSELVGCVALPFCNLTATSTVRVRLYSQPGDVIASYDSGVVLFCPYSGFDLWDWGTLALGVNAFSYGGGNYGCVWIPITSCKKAVIDIVDTDNTAGYIEASRLVMGTYWSPDHQADYGVTLTPQDSSQQYRTDGGELMTDIGTRNRKIAFNLSYMSPNDRTTFWNIQRGAGLSRSLFFSLFPEDSDKHLEESYQIYGKFSAVSAIGLPQLNAYSAPVEIEEL